MMSAVYTLSELSVEWARGRRDFGGERISSEIYTIVRETQLFFMGQVGLQFSQFRIDRLLAHLQRVANRESPDLRVDHLASQARALVPGTSGAVASTSVSPSKRPSDSPHGPSPVREMPLHDHRHRLMWSHPTTR